MGYSYGSIDALGAGVFRKIRRHLGVTAFGVNALVLLVIGAKEGYVGRDGHLADPDSL